MTKHEVNAENVLCPDYTQPSIVEPEIIEQKIVSLPAKIFLWVMAVMLVIVQLFLSIILEK